MTPLFSIIVPVYNVEAFLPACVDSVLRQSGSDYEIILFDDGSTDGSGALCDDYSRRNAPCVRTFHRPNAGLLMTRRNALAEARGRYVMFLDSDDCLAPEALGALRAVVQREQPDIILYRWRRIEMDGSLTDDESELLFSEGPVGRAAVLSRMAQTEALNSLCIKLARRELFDTDVDYTPCADVTNGEDLLQSIPVVTAAERLYYLPDTLYLYRLNTGSMTYVTLRGNYRYLMFVRQRLLNTLEREGLDTRENLEPFFWICWRRLFVLLDAAARRAEPVYETLLCSLRTAPIIDRMCAFVHVLPVSSYEKIAFFVYRRGGLPLTLWMLRFRSCVTRLLDRMRGS